MTLVQLRYFVVLAEELNFTRAAERLHISQPPLSQQIALLEERIGFKLFNRTSRRVELTEPGELFLQEVRITLDRLRNAVSKAKTVSLGVAGRIDIGLSSSHFLGPLPLVMAKYSKAHPNVTVILNELKPESQVQALLDRRTDVNISRVPINDRVLHSVPLWPDPTVIAIPKEHPLAQQEALQIADLKDVELVVLRRNSSLFAQKVFELCAVAGFTPNIIQIVEEVPAQIQLVVAGLGVAIAPLSVCRKLSEVVTRPLNEPSINSDVYAVMRRDTKKRVLDNFLELASVLGSSESLTVM